MKLLTVILMALAFTVTTGFAVAADTGDVAGGGSKAAVPNSKKASHSSKKHKKASKVAASAA